MVRMRLMFLNCVLRKRMLWCEDWGFEGDWRVLELSSEGRFYLNYASYHVDKYRPRVARFIQYSCFMH